MTSVSNYINGPYEGVSQVPPQVRLPGACEAMEDCHAVIPMGLTKRPPFEFVTQLAAITADPYALFQDIPRGSPSLDLTLLINKEGSSSKVYLFLTSAWTPVAVTISPAAQAYLDLNSPNPHRDLRAFAIEDSIFLTNRTVATGADADTAPARPHEALIWVKLGGYGKTYAVTVTPSGGTPVSASYRTSGGGSASDSYQVGTDAIAEGLYNSTTPHLPGDLLKTGRLDALASQGFTVVLNGSIIYISHPTTDFTMLINDDLGGTGMVGIKDAVQRISDLPAVGYPDMVLRVAQEGIGGTSDYYVQFTSTGSTSTGTWSECIAPGTLYGLDPETMPVVLKYDLDTTSWLLDTGDWKRRTTGTPTLSPDPTFLGSPIMSVQWQKGRLALLTEGALDLSASDDPFKFYTTTLTTAKDSDPLGFLPPAGQKTFLRDAVSNEDQLVVFGNKAQAALTALDGGIKVGTTFMKDVGKNQYTDQLAVQLVHKRAYFMATTSTHAIVMELALDRVSDKQKADDVTLSVPRYVPNTIDRVGSLEEYFMRVHGTTSQTDLYVHTLRYNENQERIQNSWHRWNLPVGYALAGSYFTGTTWYILTVASSSFHILKMDLSPSKRDPGSTGLLTHLDLRVSDEDCTVSYSPTLQRTTITLPTGALVSGDTIVSVGAGGAYPEGYLPTVFSRGSTQIILSGDWSSAPLYIGRRYASYFDASQWYALGQDQRPIKDGRLTLHNVKVDVAQFGYLKVIVSLAGRAERSFVHEGYQLDDVEVTLDNLPRKNTNTVTVSINGKAEETQVRFCSDSHYGFVLLGYEWAGDLNQRSRRRT